MSHFWSGWIILFTVISIAGSFWLLFVTRRMPNDDKETTGHNYDGIEEYNNPLPKWWLYLFYITLVFGIVYIVLYPGFGSYQGMLNWSQVTQWEEEVEEADKRHKALFAQYLQTPLEQLSKDKKALGMGKRIFLNTCFGCHGSDGAGSPGYPNLKDNDWLYGNTPEMIEQSILVGRKGTMPSFKSLLDEQQITYLTSYITQWSGEKSHESEIRQGKKLFATMCSACHGENGEGNPMIGSPNLTDDIWLYEGTRKEIARSIRNGRSGEMPGHESIIGKEKSHLVAAYVISLSQDQ